jgi:DNA polymerase-3 subunit delta'
MLFKDIIGQQGLKSHLRDMVQQHRISHALLFLGKEGTGALPLALAFSQYLVCQKVYSQLTNPHLPAGPAGSSTDSCGECPSCQKAAQLVHPDIHFSYPVIPRKSGDKPVSTDYITEWREFIKQYPYGNAYDWLQFIGAENKQGNITSQECNDINRKLSLKSFEVGFKILILWMPEYLGNEGNKLLKLIEEPPADTLFILVAENDSLILPTILSRTQLIKIAPLETNDITEALITRDGMTASKAPEIASLADGNYREALQLTRHGEEDWQALLRDWLNAILKTGPIAQVKWIDEVSKLGRERQKQFLRYFNHLLEQAVRLRVRGEGNIQLAGNEYDFAQRLNKIAGFEQQEAMIEELDKSTYYIERNANAKMLFHALTIKLYHIIANKQIATVF